MKELFTAVYDVFAPAGVKPTFYNNMGGRLRPYEARQAELFPYCVYSIIGGSPDHFMGGLTQEDFLMQFSIFTKESSFLNMGTYYNNLKAIYDECVLAVSGYSAIRMQREWNYPLRDAAENVWQYVVQYRVLLEDQA